MTSMDSQPNFQPNLNLPTVGAETGPVSPHESVGEPKPELMGTPERSTATFAKVPSPLIPALPINNSQTQFTPPAPAQPAAPAVQPISDDTNELIAKEWILRAKRIVLQTREDPYKQSQEFNKLKAEYVKQRYNMTIKGSNE
jgi:hypothetical protein